MKYTNGDDWVELEGCAGVPMRKLDALYNARLPDAFEIAKSLVKDWHMLAEGQDVAVGDAFGLTLKQWDWLRERIYEDARAEALDPEA